MNPADINLLILDVDGVLTSGVIVTGPEGESLKQFHVQDGYAIKLWRRSGGRVAVISGRSSEAVTRRAEELGIDWLRMGVGEKLPAYEAILAEAGCDDRPVAFVGDDLPDIPPMQRSALPIAVANAHPAVKRVALYVTRRAGGEGVVAEIVELLLRKQKRWSRGMVDEG